MKDALIFLTVFVVVTTGIIFLGLWENYSDQMDTCGKLKEAYPTASIYFRDNFFKPRCYVVTGQTESITLKDDIESYYLLNALGY